MEANDLMEKQQEELEKFEEQQKRSYQRGKMLVFLIAGINIAMTILENLFLSFNILQLVIQIGLAVALIRGVSWVRYLYAGSGIFMIIIGILILGNDFMFLEAPSVLVLFLVIYFAYIIGTTAILLFSRSVKEFMYQQRNG